MVDSIVRKTDSILNKDEDMLACLPGARIEHVTQRVQQIMGRGHGGTILDHIGTNNADKEGTTAIVNTSGTYCRRRSKRRVDRYPYQGFYQCLEAGANGTELQGGWPSMDQ